MKRHKGLIPIVLLILLLAVSGIAGAVTIEYSAWGSATTLEAHEREAKAFAEKYPNSGITVEPIINGWNELKDKMFVQAAAGSLPDIIMVPNGFWPEMAELGLLLDLEPFINRDADFDATQLSPGVIDIMRVNNTLYTLPTGGFTPTGAMVSLNLDMVEAAGLTAPSRDWNWDDYLLYAKRLTRRQGDRVLSWGTNIGKSTWSGAWAMRIASDGGHLVDPEGKIIITPVLDPNRLRINTPVVQGAFQYLKDLVDVHDVALPEGMDASEAFTGGNLAMQNAWSGTARNYAERDDIRIAIAPTPQGTAGHHGVWAHVGLPHVYAISAQTENPEAAWKVLKFLVSEEEALLARGTEGLGTVSYRELVPVYESLAKPEWREWLDIGAHYINNVPSEGNELWKTVPVRVVDVLIEEVSAAYNNQQSMRGAVERAHERAAQILRDEARE